MNNKERLVVLKKVLGLGNSQKDTTPEFEDVFNKNYGKLLVNDKNIPEPKPIKKCFSCHKAINDGINTTHPSWSIYCSDCVLGMKL